MTIKDVTIDDEGYYKVEARNEHGVATTVVELFVQSKLHADLLWYVCNPKQMLKKIRYSLMKSVEKNTNF